jgi:hypothetical protein
MQWTRQFGTGGDAFANAVAVDSVGNAFIAGLATSLGRDNGTNSFVAKYDTAGTALWTRQFGSSISSSTTTYLNAISVDGSGNAFVAGFTATALPGQMSSGEQDAFFIRLSP